MFRSATLLSSVISLFTSVEAQKKSISVPISRINGFATPITDTQQLYADFHRQRLENDPELLKTALEEEGGIPITLLNTQNTGYTGPLLFGTPADGSTTSEFIYDTGSGWLTVTSEECSNCHTKYYDESASSTSQVVD